VSHFFFFLHQRERQFFLMVTQFRNKYKNAKTLFDLTKGSRWSYRTCQQVADQYFVAEIPFYSYPQVIKLKNHFDDIDCVKELKVFSWRNLSVSFPNSKEEDEEKGWVECFTFTSQQTKEWQEFKTNLTVQQSSRWFKIQVFSTYGRYSCIESIQFGIACRFSQVIMREEPPKPKDETPADKNATPLPKTTSSKSIDQSKSKDKSKSKERSKSRGQSKSREKAQVKRSQTKGAQSKRAQFKRAQTKRAQAKRAQAKIERRSKNSRSI
ncbi:hypothetical protein RFI_07501, partial [Reticulomyxa filosa]